MCKTLNFKFWIFTHFSRAAKIPHGIASVNLRLYPLTNSFNIYILCWEKCDDSIPVLSSTYSYNDQSNCRLLSSACLPLPVHHLSFWYCSEIFSDLSNYKLLVHSLSTTCPLLVHYLPFTITHTTTDYWSTTCWPFVHYLPITCLSLLYFYFSILCTSSGQMVCSWRGHWISHYSIWRTGGGQIVVKK